MTASVTSSSFDPKWYVIEARLAPDSGDAASLAAAAEVGKLFVRKDKAASPKVATASTKGSTESETSVTKSTDETKSESVDVLALIDSWLRDASDAQFAARLVLVNNLLATIESDRAAAQAELDSAEVAA